MQNRDEKRNAAVAGLAQIDQLIHLVEAGDEDAIALARIAVAHLAATGSSVFLASMLRLLQEMGSEALKKT